MEDVKVNISKSILIVIILSMLTSPCIFADSLSCPTIIAQLNDSLGIKDLRNDLVIASNATSRNNSDSNRQNTVETTTTTTNNNSITTAERQAISQKHNMHKVGPVPDEPNAEPIGSHAL